MSYADKVFAQTCRDILDHGVWDTDLQVRPHWEDGTPAHTIKLFGVVNRYDLSKEFPILTLRKQYLKSAIDEILWIWQKKSNKVSELNSHVWDAWADANGTLGLAYGHQLGKKYLFKWGVGDQVDNILWSLKNDPASRRMIANMFNHQDLCGMTLEPCAYSMTFNVSGNKLNAILNQRSQDMLTAGNWNVIQYSALLIMFAQATGYEPGELVHVIADCHIYDRHVPIVEKMIEREGYEAPKLWVNETVKDFYDFTVNDFTLIDYKAHPLDEKIEVAI